MTRGAGRHVVRPLTREPSAGARWRPSSTVREDRWREEAVGAARIRQSSWQMGPQPHPGGLLPVQRKLAAPRRRCPEPGMRTIRRLCSRAVLVAEVDERRLVQSLTRLGLALRPRARRVKGRPKPAHGGKAAGTVAGSRRSRALAPQGERSRGSEHSSREGVLVSTKRSSLTSGSRRRAWRLHRQARPKGWIPFEEGCDRGRQRLRHGLGTRTRTPLPGGATRRGSRSRPRQDRAALVPVLTRVRGHHPEREDAGPPSATPKLEVRRQAKLHPGIHGRPLANGGSAASGPRPQGSSLDQRSGIGQSRMGARIVGWLQKSERRIFPAAVARPGATREARGRWDSLKRPVGL